MSADVLVGGAKFMERLAHDIISARESVCVQTLTFEGDEAGLALARALIASRAPRRRVLVDSFNQFFQSDCFVYAPRNLRGTSPIRVESRATSEMIASLRRNGVEVRYTNPVGFFMRRLLARDHKKMAVIDGNTSFFGGINFSDHNFAWHDMMVRAVRADLANALTHDFNATWEGVHAPATTLCGDIELLNFDGSCNEATCSRLLSAIDSAQDVVHVLSPYMTFPFTDALRRAVGRGVRVIVVTSRENNRGFLNTYMRAEAARSGFDLRLYEGGMSHLKAMLIDGHTLVVGSSNFDWLTYHVQAEVVCVTTSRDMIDSFVHRVLEPDLALSCRAPLAPAWPAPLIERVLQLVAFVAGVICKPAPRPAGLPVSPGRTLTHVHA